MIDTNADLSRNAELAIQTVMDVFSTMLDIEATLSGSAPETHFPIQGAIYFVGDWKGAALVEFESSLAFALTANLEEVPEPTALDSNVRDAIGETVNMLAGNLKVILPGKPHMSMPSVVEGADFVVSVIGGNRFSRLDFSTSKGRFALLLIKANDD